MTSRKHVANLLVVMALVALVATLALGVAWWQRPDAPTKGAPADPSSDGGDAGRAAQVWATEGTLDAETGTMVLDVLPVASPRPEDGYTPKVLAPTGRADTPDWQGRGIAQVCTVDQAVLLRDGRDTAADDSCTITAGTWVDPFTGASTTDPQEFTVHPVIPPREVWRAGGADWTPQQRTAYATHPLALVVAAADPRGGRGPQQWAPDDPQGRCAYALRWVAVKNEFGLALTSQGEKKALARMIAGCSQHQA